MHYLAKKQRFTVQISSHVFRALRQVQRNVKLTCTSDYLAIYLTTGFNGQLKCSAREQNIYLYVFVFSSYIMRRYQSSLLDKQFDICEQLQ